MIMDFLKESFGSFFGKILSRGKEEMIYRMKLEMWKFQRKVMKTIISACILLLSVAMLALAAIFYLIEYAHLSKTISFLILGIILLVVGILLKI
ncbi:hypothetical protein FJZ19_02560 [Candidatus Pacearchaeota archaeon]|nr:hypothetical protein [Candidatus Pacearchaeota archaeon]